MLWLFVCLLQSPFLKFFGACNTPYDRMLDCMKQERLARRAANAKNAAERQAAVRERVKNDNTDYDELLKHYRKEYRAN